jgi:hypothetical protein
MWRIRDLLQDPAPAVKTADLSHSPEMVVTTVRVLLPTYGSRGDVEPLLDVVQLSLGFGAEAWMCPSPDFAELRHGVGMPPVPTGASP